MPHFDQRAVYRTYVPMRWNDFDRYGHLNNAQYIELAQEARVQFTVNEFPRAGMTAPAFFLRHLEVDFLKPVLPNKDNRVLIETVVENIGTTSMTVRQEIKDPDGRVAAVVTSVSVAMDRESASPRAITSAEKKILTRWAESATQAPMAEIEGSAASGRTQDSSADAGSGVNRGQAENSGR